MAKKKKNNNSSINKSNNSNRKKINSEQENINKKIEKIDSVIRSQEANDGNIKNHKSIKLPVEANSDGISYDQFFILVIASLITWLGVHKYFIGNNDNRKLANKEKEIVELHESLITDRLKDLSDRIKVIDEESKSKDLKIKYLEEESASKGNNISIIKAEYSQNLEEKDKEIKLLNTRLEAFSALMKTKNELEEKYELLNQENINIKAEITSKLRELNELKEKLNIIETSVTEYKKSMEDYAKKNTELEAEKAELIDKLNKVETAITPSQEGGE